MTTPYRPPLGDIAFVLEEIADLAGLASLPGFEHADPATTAGILEEFGRFVVEVVAPLDRIGDEHGVTHDPAAAAVTTPPGFPEAYRRLVEAGWGGVAFDPELGGGGFPWAVGLALQELLSSACLSFSVGPLLTQGAIDLLSHHGSEEQREVYVRRLVPGDWMGTMNLTEPEAGSDVGALRTKAVPSPDGDGTWRITGQKIFITHGEHDWTDQIVHLVLARVPDAPPGTRGISCFIVPKHLVNDDGSLGERNAVRCLSVEHKMGIHASPTCVMEYDGAVGYLIGEPNSGMRAMFTMMNNARLSVGLQGLAVGERALQAAVAFAQERRQGRAPGAPAGEASVIADHPDVRRMLLTMRACVDAMRALLYLTAAGIDRARRHPDEAVRAAAQEEVDLLIPVAKAWCTDLGNEVASLAIQVHGGMGYIEETGVAQLYRDIRIAPIYEGTNGIQAIDLVGRKLPMRAGGVVADHLDRLRALDAELGAVGELAAVRAALADGVEALAEATAWLLKEGASDPAAAFAGATPYLRMFGLVTGGWLLARSALAAHRRLGADGDGGPAGGDDPEYLRARIVVARFYAAQLLPGATGLLGAITGGAGDLFAMDAAELDSR